MVDPHLPSSPSAPVIGRVAVWRFLRHIVFLVGIGLLAGLIAGFLGLGVGSRVAMRIVALLAGHGHYGEITDAEEVVGQITLDGTGFLVAAGTVVGVPGGLLYVIVRRWVPGAGIWKGLAFGGLVLALFGSLVIEGDNPDFRRFVPSIISVLLFALVLVVYGLVAVWVVERLDRGGGTSPRNRFLAVGGCAMLAAAVIVGGAKDFQALAEIF